MQTTPLPCTQALGHVRAWCTLVRSAPVMGVVAWQGKDCRSEGAGAVGSRLLERWGAPHLGTSLGLTAG